KSRANQFPRGDALLPPPAANVLRAPDRQRPATLSGQHDQEPEGVHPVIPAFAAEGESRLRGDNQQQEDYRKQRVAVAKEPVSKANYLRTHIIHSCAPRCPRARCSGQKGPELCLRSVLLSYPVLSHKPKISRR